MKFVMKISRLTLKIRNKPLKDKSFSTVEDLNKVYSIPNLFIIYLAFELTTSSVKEALPEEDLFISEPPLRFE